MKETLKEMELQQQRLEKGKDIFQFVMKQNNSDIEIKKFILKIL
jgi:hypothetical protein